MGDEDPDLDRARGGDREAFGRLVRRHQRRVYAAAIHILGESYRLEGEARRVGRRSAGLSGPFSNPLVWQVLAQSQAPRRGELDRLAALSSARTISGAR